MFKSLLLSIALLLPYVVLGDTDVTIDIKNVSGEAKTNWPVIIPVTAIFGRNLPTHSLNKQGYHVYDSKGKEIPHMIESLPPYEEQGNNEIIFIIPTMKKDEMFTFRITNTAKKSSLEKTFDLLNNQNNLLKNAGFESLFPPPKTVIPI